MKIKGPNDGPTRAEPVGASDDVAAPAQVDKAQAATKVAAAGSASAADPIREIAAQVKSGAITVDDAVELIVDRTIKHRLAGAVTAAERQNPQVAEQVRNMMRELTKSDPHLMDQLRRLTK